MRESIVHTIEETIPEIQERQTHMDEFGIERLNETPLLGNERAHFMMSGILEHPALIPFFGFEKDDIPRMKACAQFYDSLRRGLTPPIPPDEDLRIYRLALDTLSRCPVTPPMFVTRDEQDPELFHFCLEARKERPAVMEGGKYYLLYKIKDAEHAEEMKSRIAAANQSSYFPDMKIISRTDSEYIGVEFVPHSNPVQRGEDVSDFIDACKAMDFGPDTNVTNFTRRNDGRLVYFDGDLVDWINDPQGQPFAKAALAKKSPFSKEPWDESRTGQTW